MEMSLAREHLIEPLKSSTETSLIEAIDRQSVEEVERIIENNLLKGIDLNCLDKDELTPLQHVCHNGNLEIAKLLLDYGADVNFTKRKDGYTPLMFAAISGRVEVVKLLLERHVDTTVENCVNRTAAQMAAFVGQSKIVAVINSWVSWESSVGPYLEPRELEEEPRIGSMKLGVDLHNFIVYPSLHPVKLLLFIKETPNLIKEGSSVMYVLENLSSKALKPPHNEECLSLKYYYLSYLIQYCLKHCKEKPTDIDRLKFDWHGVYGKFIDTLVRRLIKREDADDIKPCTSQLDHFILECLLRYPYTQLAIFKTMTFALTKREAGDLTALAILTQTLNGPRMFGQPTEACAVCGELDKNKKCGKCKSIYYCGPSCQHADWFQHKKVCKGPDEIPLLNSNGKPNSG